MKQNIIQLWRNRFTYKENLILFVNSEEKNLIYSLTFKEWLSYLKHGVSETSLLELHEILSNFTKNEDIFGQLITHDIIAQQYDQLGVYKEALKHLHFALELKSDNDFSPEIADLFATQGNVYFRINEFDKALKCYTNALEIRTTNNDLYAKASAINLIARLMSEMGNWDEAIEKYQEVIELRTSIKDSAIVWSFFGLANVLLIKKEFENALLIANNSHCEETAKNSIRFRYVNDILKAKCYNELNQPSNAIEILEQLKIHSKDFDSKPLQYQMIEQLSLAYELDKNIPQSFEYYKKYVALKNEVINEENNQQIRNQEINFSIERIEKEKEIERLKNVELKNALEEISEKNHELLSSLTYAKRLQEAILPPPRLVKEWLTESFLFYRPKDIVSGDFYWMETVDTFLDGQQKTLIFFAAADCTGHGVPGAMVSVVCANALNRSVKEFQLKTPGEVLNKVTELVLEAFEQSEDIIKDGMDIALCALDLSSNKLYYSGANNPLYRITKVTKENDNKYKSPDGIYELLQYDACRSPIGKQETKHNFLTQEIQLFRGDAIYMFSDGFADQFGGEKGKKYKYANFKFFLLSQFSKPMEIQKVQLENEFDEWKKNYEQIDDVCIIGVKINDNEKQNLTPREMEILSLLANGLSSHLIADKLYISKHTVDTHRRRLLAKTGTANTQDLINYARNKDII